MPDASGPAQPDQFAQMVDDRASEGQFRIDRRMYDDEAVFEAEMERIFEATWMYVAHESQIPSAGDYIWTEVGRQPVIINRLDDGSVRRRYQRLFTPGRTADGQSPGQRPRACVPVSRLDLQILRRVYSHQG